MFISLSPYSLGLGEIFIVKMNFTLSVFPDLVLVLLQDGVYIKLGALKKESVVLLDTI